MSYLNQTIYDDSEIPGKQFFIRSTITSESVFQAKCEDQVQRLLYEIKKQLAHSIIHKIMEDGSFFKVVEKAPFPYIDIDGSCIVLGVEEWREWAKKQFMRGFDFARSRVMVMP